MLAERLADVELRSWAWGAQSVVAFSAGDFEAALDGSRRRLALVREISDPDHVADIYENAVPSFCALGRLDEVRQLASEHDKVVAPLSAHHRLHGVAVTLEVEENCGGWERIRGLADRTEAVVEANLATPCVRNARSLLVSALAAAYAGDEERSRRYERRADEIAGEGFDFVFAAPRTRLALLRGDLDTVDGLLELLGEAFGRTAWYGVASAAARLDALAPLGHRSVLEEEATALLSSRTYFEPFALRALGTVREDATLIARAVERFEAMRLGWHAAQTRALL